MHNHIFTLGLLVMIRIQEQLSVTCFVGEVCHIENIKKWIKCGSKLNSFRGFFSNNQ